jgi:hypothetical protein
LKLVPVHEVEAHGGSVWINSPSKCLARFKEGAFEVFSDSPTYQVVPSLEGASWQVGHQHWEDFRCVVQREFGIQVDPSHAPDWVFGARLQDHDIREYPRALVRLAGLKFLRATLQDLQSGAAVNERAPLLAASCRIYLQSHDAVKVKRD